MASRMRSPVAAEAWGFIRGVLFLGRRYVCPCCGWHVRAFNDGGTKIGRAHV